MKPYSWQDFDDSFQLILEHLAEAQDRLNMLEDVQAKIALKRIYQAETVLLRLFREMKRALRKWRFQTAERR